jgi:hypothetical protein
MPCSTFKSVCDFKSVCAFESHKAINGETFPKVIAYLSSLFTFQLFALIRAHNRPYEAS